MGFIKLGIIDCYVLCGFEIGEMFEVYGWIFGGGGQNGVYIIEGGCKDYVVVGCGEFVEDWNGGCVFWYVFCKVCFDLIVELLFDFQMFVFLCFGLFVIVFQIWIDEVDFWFVSCFCEVCKEDQFC